MKKSSRYISLVLLIGLGFWVKTYYSKDNNSFERAEGDTVTVLTINPKVGKIYKEVKTVATLEPEYEAKVVNGTPGLLEEVLVPAGSWVKKGQEIAKLKPEAFLRAPIDGVVLDWLDKEGNYLEVGSHLADIMEPKVLLVNYTLPEKLFNQVKVGQKIVLTTKSLPGKDYIGEVVYVAPSADPLTHQIHVRARINNDSRELIPGLFVHIAQLLEEKPNAILVPETVITKNIDGSTLFVVRDGLIKKVNLTIGQEKNSEVEIISGISKDEDIIFVVPIGVGQIKEKVKIQKYNGDW